MADRQIRALRDFPTIAIRNVHTRPQGTYVGTLIMRNLTLEAVKVVASRAVAGKWVAPPVVNSEIQHAPKQGYELASPAGATLTASFGRDHD